MEGWGGAASGGRRQEDGGVETCCQRQAKQSALSAQLALKLEGRITCCSSLRAKGGGVSEHGAGHYWVIVNNDLLYDWLNRQAPIPCQLANWPTLSDPNTISESESES